ncbi:hypothetical protein T11_3989 [Trichinella zimbabwensis]|uniref:Uncharacterized protein n=1 Tax=Trichinella zimbabwensis TaxID=268475 RepID=A0A0V1HRC8_9BILA|nr:hypothetical protein T11_3989 [Trichinella zimbabwensis]
MVKELNIIQVPHLAWVLVACALLHCMHDQLVICQDDEMSSFMPMLKVMKTEIDGKQLTSKRTSLGIVEKLHQLRSQTRRLLRTTQLRPVDGSTVSPSLVPALPLRTL